MSWSQGDLITADKLNSENGSIYSTINYTSTNTRAYYFYVTKNTGNITSISGTVPNMYNSTVCILSLYKIENNSFVLKQSISAAPSGWAGSSPWTYGDFPSYGEGSYMLKLEMLVATKYPDLTIKIYNAKTNNIRGNLLRMINDMSVNQSHKDFSYSNGSLISASALNAGRVFTT